MPQAASGSAGPSTVFGVLPLFLPVADFEENRDIKRRGERTATQTSSEDRRTPAAAVRNRRIALALPGARGRHPGRPRGQLGPCVLI